MPSISRYVRLTVTTDRGSEREARKVLDDVLKNIPKGYNYADLGRVKVEVSKPSY